MRRIISSLLAVGGCALVALTPGQARAWTPKTLVSFCALAKCADGSSPVAGLIADANGNLFGTTANGGAGITNGEVSFSGTVFEIAKTATGYASTPTTLVSFCSLPNCADGASPLAGMMMDANGGLFSTSWSGGTGAGGFGGTVFKIVKTTSGYASTPTTLVNTCALANCADGGQSNAGLVADANGNLFGTGPSGGGTHGGGTVFEIAKTANGYANTTTTLVSFCSLPNCADGAFPYGGLVMDANGNLFGTTSAGGANSAGTVYEIVKTASGYASTPTTLVSFSGGDGANPFGNLIADSKGNLFGTTSFGGASSAGTVFQIIKTASGYASTTTILVSFCSLPNCADGANPRAGLIMDANGNLFGTTAGGGENGDGTVFEVVKTASGYASTPDSVSFNGTNGSAPTGGLFADANGNLFGTTSAGGANGAGTVFEITGGEFVPDAPFASLSAALIINRSQQPGFTLDARFRLGAGSDGIDPLTEPVTVQIGPYTAAIPADSFRKLPGRGLRVYAFSGEASNAWLTLDILSHGRNSYQFGASGTSVALRAPNPVPVSLRIGYDAGSTVVRVVRVP